jgi:hypothetical protein
MIRTEVINWLERDGWQCFPYLNNRDKDDYMLAPPSGWHQRKSHVIGSYFASKEHRPILVKVLANYLHDLGWRSETPMKHQSAHWTMPSEYMTKLLTGQSWQVRYYRARGLTPLEALALQSSLELGYPTGWVNGDIFLHGVRRDMDHLAGLMRAL